MDKPSNERRKHRRVYRNFILSYHEKGRATPKYDISQVHNVSKGGMSFASTHALKLGAVIEINLKTSFIADPFILQGVVLESREKIAEMIYEIRIEFKDITEHKLHTLEKIESYGAAKD